MGPVLKMEPFFVGGSMVHWRYCRIPGYEVLSRYPDETTRDFLRVLREAQRLLDFVVPVDFQAKFDVDHILILCDQEVMSPMYANLLNSSSGRGLWDSTRLGDPVANAQHYAFPNVEVGDMDRIASLVTSKGDPLSTTNGLISIAHVRYLLDRRTPALPAWVVAGIMGLYADLYSASETPPIADAKRPQPTDGSDYISMSELQSTDPDSAERLGGANTHRQHREVVYRIPPLVWRSPERTARLADDGDVFGSDDTERSRIMEGLLTGVPPASPAELELWKARATLFARWALDKEYRYHTSAFVNFLSSAFEGPVTRRFVVDGSNSPHRDAFWNYVSRSSEGPVTEASFKECFGLSYAQVAAKLAAYLPVATRAPIDLRLDWSAGEADPGLQDAGRNEIARMKGDWERMALGDVKSEYRDYASNSVKLALLQVYDAGAKYSRFQAVIGLLDCDLGDDAEAKNYLESAVQGNVVGPRAYYELARLRYDEVASVEGVRLTAADIERVMAPLRAGSSQAPPLLESYELAAKAMAQGDGVTRLQLKYLESAERYFPRNLELIYEAATLDAAHGYPAEASTLAAEAAAWATTPKERARFSALLNAAAK